MSVFNLKKAIPNVKGPSLPKNIVTVRMILAAVDNVDVIPRLKPTVPRAEAVSKYNSKKEWLSKRQIKSVLTDKIITFHIKALW